MIDHLHPPAWVTGGLSTGDAEFLIALVHEVDPRFVIEIGIAAGTSSAALLFALDTSPAGGRGRCLFSVDVRSTCYFDERRPVGSAVAEMYPGHRAIWIVDTNGSASRSAAFLRGAPFFDLALVDANHKHPFPLLDVLHLAPVLGPAAWVALHDIRLPEVCPAFQTFGAKWLFDEWEFEKRAGTGEARNIGAIRLPADLTALNRAAVRLLERFPWEAIPPDGYLGLDPMFAAVLEAYARRRPASRSPYAPGVH